MYAIPADVESAARMRHDLNIKTADDLEVIALNMKRGWWRHYSSKTFEVLELEDFVDAIKLGEGSKQKLPSNFGGLVDEETNAKAEAESSSVEDGPPMSEDPNIVTEVDSDETAPSGHDEL
jgi:protein disulfide-isomerase A6